MYITVYNTTFVHHHSDETSITLGRTYTRYLVYVLHWPDDGCFTAETCSPNVIDISSLC